MPPPNGDPTSYKAQAPDRMNNMSSESDSEFEDTHIETPVALRETSKSFNDGLYLRTTTTIPLKDDATRNTIFSTPTRTGKRKALVSFSDEERELIRKEKVITNNDEFSPRGPGSSPARRMRLTFLDSQKLLDRSDIERSNFEIPVDKDIEFDVSDRDLPEKGTSTTGNQKSTALYEEYKQLVTKTPQRLSPLKREIIPSSNSVKSAAVAADEIIRSGATRSKTAQEIIDQINSSIDKMREVEGVLASDHESDSDEEEILREIDSYLPKPMHKRGITPLGSPSHVAEPHSISSLAAFNERIENEERNKSEKLAASPHTIIARGPLVSPKPISPKLAIIDVDEAPETHENGNLILSTRNSKVTKRRASAANRKLSGKYARDIFRKRKLTEPPRKYESWLYEQWDKLKRLVELSIPKNVLINSTIVLRDLGCKDKEELAQRIKFLSRRR